MVASHGSLRDACATPQFDHSYDGAVLSDRCRHGSLIFRMFRHWFVLLGLSFMMMEKGGGMGSTYRTFMVDPLGALRPGLGNAIQSQLAVLFSPIVGSDNFFENNWVFFNPAAAAPVMHELLVYFMPPRVSIVKHAPNLNQQPDLSKDGNTAYGSGASEVYVKGNYDAVLLAKLAFHELMHNRLKLDNHLHAQGGLAAESITGSTQLSSRNIKSMAAVLRNPITQWIGGITMLNNGRHDPMSEYYKI